MRSKGFLVILIVIFIFIQISSLCFADNDETTGVNTSGSSVDVSGTDADIDSDADTGEGTGSSESGSEDSDADGSEAGGEESGADSTESDSEDSGADSSEAGSKSSGAVRSGSGSKGSSADSSQAGSEDKDIAGSEADNMGAGKSSNGADGIGYGAASRVPAPEISAPSAILVEAETGQTLYYKNSETPLHISAANKLMTILVAVENGQLSSYVTVSSDSIDTEGSAINLTVGQKYLLSDLLYAIMLTSANDAAVAVAEHISSGDINKFVELMNKTAEKLGMTSTYFVNPTGLYDEAQYTTAKDISKLVRYAIKNPQFTEIFTTKARIWYGKGNEGKFFTSSNRLFWEYDGIRGGKTGYNNKDQQTVICTAARSNLQLISIVLDAPEKTMYSDTTALFDYGFNNFWKSTLVSKNEIIKKVEYEGNEVRLVSQNDIMYVHPIGESYIKEFNAKADLKPPLKRTIPAGSAVYVLGDGTEVSINLYPDSEIVPAEDMKTRIQKRIVENKDIFLIVAILLVIEALLLLYNIGKLFSRFVSLILRRIRRS